MFRPIATRRCHILHFHLYWSCSRPTISAHPRYCQSRSGTAFRISFGNLHSLAAAIPRLYRMPRPPTKSASISVLMLSGSASDADTALRTLRQRLPCRGGGYLRRLLGVTAHSRRALFSGNVYKHYPCGLVG